ncbi:MAG TPA: hypothetical protein VIH99_10190 [Bdellovibrionota bacterium]|jgi:hypothetical protein
MGSLTARTYNQNHLPRPWTRGKRRISVYWSWSYPWESNRDPSVLDNRFSTMTEVRRVAWPVYETQEWSHASFLQGIAGTLELFHRSLLDFQRLAGEESGFPVAVYQRIDQAGFPAPIDERILDDTDTLFVYGLDHLEANLTASPEEIAAIRAWLRREGTCLVIGPHHDVGFSDDPAIREMEYRHHRDPLVPRQQRFSTYSRSLLKALDVPVINRWGLHPLRDKNTKELAPVSAHRELDGLGLLQGVTTLNYHPHLPHYEVLEGGNDRVHVLARQPIDRSRPHPFLEAGNTEFNMLLWMPPAGERAGQILLADSTIFTTLFGTSESLRTFWKNLVTMPDTARGRRAA